MLIALTFALASWIPAQDIQRPEMSYAGGVLVTTGDITNCPYRLVGPVATTASVEFGSTSQEAIFGKLRAKAQKIGADAVVLVTVSQPRMTAFSFKKRSATGRAVQFIDRKCVPTPQ